MIFKSAGKFKEPSRFLADCTHATVYSTHGVSHVRVTLLGTSSESFTENQPDYEITILFGFRRRRSMKEVKTRDRTHLFLDTDQFSSCGCFKDDERTGKDRTQLKVCLL